MALHSFSIMGRIDELEDIDTPRKLHDHLAHLEIGCYIVAPGTFDFPGPVPADFDPPLHTDQGNPYENWAEYLKMYSPAGFDGVYMVTGIEGKYYDGYVSGELQKAEDGEVRYNDVPWPLAVTPEMSVFDIMVAVAASEANGYPDVNHVWFEAVDIDDQAHTMHFCMGS